jgi:hypothetical protein
MKNTVQALAVIAITLATGRRCQGVPLEFRGGVSLHF